ncbi:MAG: beta-galactosidase [Lentisphaeria bacterium]|nr:beta-galactosidase [Lentisphaeria bacterium]
MKKLLCLLLLFMLTLPLSAFKCQEISDKNGNYIRIESDELILHIRRMGGCIARYYYKQGRQELVNSSGRLAFTEMDWDKTVWDFFYKRLFKVDWEQQKNKFIVTCKANHPGGFLDFLEITKKYIITKGSPVVYVEYSFFNMEQAMNPVRYSLHIHTGLTLAGVDDPTYFLPTQTGIIDKRKSFADNPARGWIGTVSPRQVGFTVNMSFPELYNFLLWGNASLEWRYLPFDIGNGAAFKTFAEVVPFTGLPKVSGSGRGVAGAIIHQEKCTANTTVSAEVKLFNAVAGRRITVKLMARESGTDKWDQVAEQALDFRKAATALSFKVQIPLKNKSVELEAVMRTGNGEIGRLNSRIQVDADNTPWNIEPLENKIKTDLRRGDLTSFNHTLPEPDAVPWAKPLPDGKLKVLALGAKISQLRDLTHRLEMDMNNTWLFERGNKFASPTYLLNEFSGKMNFHDVLAGLNKVMKKDYDVILIAGFSWQTFPASVRKAILDKVKNGTGLVFTALRDPLEFLKLTGKGAVVKAGKISVLKNSPLTSGVPLDFLPVGRIFKFRGGETIHALSGSDPYIISAKYGKGTVVGFTYFANTAFTGMIPADLPEPHMIFEKPTPYEFYFGMICKALLYAGRKKSAVVFKDFKAVTSPEKSTFVWQTGSSKAFNGKIDYMITDRYNQIRLKGRTFRKFATGKNTLTLTLPVLPYKGKQLISIIVRDPRGASVNYGSWSFTYDVPCSITHIKCDKKSYKDGENIHYEVTFGGHTANCRAEVELIDSYSRTLSRRTGTPEEVQKGHFKLANALPSRYSRIRVRLLDKKGREMDTNGTWFYTRPAEKLMVWDDFKINSIIYWDGPDSFFRMKRLAAHYREALGLDILFNNWGLYRVLLGNFEPRMWALSAIGSQNYPGKDYLRTGNKKYLVRSNCLSDEKRMTRYFKNLAEKAKTGHAYGAVLYDNGDEVALSRSGTPVDFCFSEACLKNFRKFLRKRYGTLANLNKNWNSQFASWESVLPYTKEEVWASKGRKVAGWADHREFMDNLCYEHLSKARSTLRKIDPGARYMNSGTQYPNAYGGIDWWKLMKCHDALQNYGTGDHDEIQRSFAGSGYVSIPWYLGYGNKKEKEIYDLWRSSLLGNSGMSMWCINSCVLYPDLRVQPGIKGVMPHVKVLKDGVGKLLMNVYAPRTPQVAILYSQASLRAAFIEKRQPEHGGLWEKYTNLCRHLGAEFKFLSYEQLSSGELDKSANYKMLVLSDATALSDAEVEAVKRFFKRGGVVLAEGIPATRFANCVKRPVPALNSIFKNSKGQGVLIDAPDTDYVLLMAGPDGSLNRKQILFTQNFFAARLKKAGIAVRPFKILHTDGTPVVEAAFFIRQAADGSYLGGAVSKYDKVKEVKVLLPLKGHTYDLVTGKYFGNVKEIRKKFSLAYPMALVILPQKIAIAETAVKGAALSFTLNHSFDSVINIKVYAPDGREVREYGTNLLIRKGKGGYTIPFAISDANGTWKVICKEVISGQTCSLTVKK